MKKASKALWPILIVFKFVWSVVQDFYLICISDIVTHVTLS